MRAPKSCPAAKIGCAGVKLCALPHRPGRSRQLDLLQRKGWRNAQMTHRPTLESWATLLRPALPLNAELALKPNLGQLCASWPPGSAVTIFIAPNAVKDYRKAEDGVRALADQNMLEFVKENLRRF